MSQRFTASEAYAQAKRDAERVEDAVTWFTDAFGPLTKEQALQIRTIVGVMIYDDHVRKGKLGPPGK